MSLKRVIPAAVLAAIESASEIGWSIGGCDTISIRRDDDGWSVWDSRPVRQGARQVGASMTLETAVRFANSIIRQASEARTEPRK